MKQCGSARHMKRIEKGEMSDFSELVPAGLQHPRIKQYLTLKNNTKSNPENLACLEGLWEVSLAVTHQLDIRGCFVCPEFLPGDTAHHVAPRIAKPGFSSILVPQT